MYVQAGHTATGEKDAPVTNLVEQTRPCPMDQAQPPSHCSLILLVCILPPALAWYSYVL